MPFWSASPADPFLALGIISAPEYLERRLAMRASWLSLPNVGPGKPPVPAAALKGFTVGPTKGLTIKLPSGGTRLMIPGENEWSASVYSDDHGKTVSAAAPFFSSPAKG